MDNLINDIEKRMRFEGIRIFGTSDIREYVSEQIKDFGYAITIGVRMSDAVIDDVKTGPTHTYFHNYRTANALLDRCAMIACTMLMDEGYKAIAVPASQSISGTSGLIPHKTAAVHAGLGYIGKSALFISNEYGPRVRLATILTDKPLISGKLVENKCGSCKLCVEACPCGAISGKIVEPGMQVDDYFDREKCSMHMKKAYKHIGRGAVCGICIAVCPKSKT